MTGDPVSMREYSKSLESCTSALVRLDLVFLIVVLSSTATMPRLPNRLANQVPTLRPLTVEKISTFITKIVIPSNVSFTDLISRSCSLFGLLTQRITRYGTLSGKCCGISRSTQLRYTPLGAMIKAKLISSRSYKCTILSIRTLDLPVPISINSAKYFLSWEASKASI